MITTIKLTVTIMLSLFLLLSTIHNQSSSVHGLILETWFPSPTTPPLFGLTMNVQNNRSRSSGRRKTLVHGGYCLPYSSNTQMYSIVDMPFTFYRPTTTKSALMVLFGQRQDNNDDNEKGGGQEDNDDDSNIIPGHLRLQRLQNELLWIEAIEERNRAQLDSFIDEQHQWESLDSDEKDLLLGKQSIMDTIEKLMKEGV
jgi:hypothetical protein